MPLGGGFDGVIKLVGVDVLEEVADRSGSYCLDDTPRLIDAGENEHLDLGHFVANEGGRCDPVQLGHDEVHQHDVWPQSPRETDGLAACTSLTNDLEFRLPE
jgi:hypothetical protein